MNDLELRKVILQLVKACNRSRTNLMGANAAIQAMSTMTPAERKALTSEQIKSELKNIQQQLAQQPDPNGVEIEKVLSGDGDYLEPLRKFVSGLHW